MTGGAPRPNTSPVQGEVARRNGETEGLAG